MKPLVSIITPSYNQGRFIRQTIESVLSQNYENFEYIIIDGGSTDDTLNIISEYKDRLAYISEKDNGQSDAINKGFRMAKGEIVAWLNSDDTYEPDCIAKAVEEFENNENLGLVYGDGYITDDHDNKLKIFGATQEFDLWTLINVWDYIMQPATFFRAKYLREVGYLDVNLHWCMDWDLWIKLALVSDVKYVKEIFACSREYGDTKTSTGGDKRLREITMLMQKYSCIEKPLGVQLYKSSTLFTKYENNWLMRNICRFYMGYVNHKVFTSLPVRYADGWIGPRYSFVIPTTKKEVEFDIEIPVDKILPVTITISVNNDTVKSVSYNHVGKYNVGITLENNSKAKHMEIKSNKYFVPYGSDNRKLSVLINNLTFK